MPESIQEIIDLQTRLAFQEDSIDEMNVTIVRQQKEIEMLQKEIIQLKELIEELRENSVSGSDAIEHEVPPHY